MAASIEHYQLPLPAFDGPVRLLIVVSPYYRQIADGMIEGARAVAADAGAVVDLVEVPGALEIPTAIGLAADYSYGQLEQTYQMAKDLRYKLMTDLTKSSEKKYSEEEFKKIMSL